jgi:hypothetical protein
MRRIIKKQQGGTNTTAEENEILNVILSTLLKSTDIDDLKKIIIKYNDLIDFTQYLILVLKSPPLNPNRYKIVKTILENAKKVDLTYNDKKYGEEITALGIIQVYTDAGYDEREIIKLLHKYKAHV